MTIPHGGDPATAKAFQARQGKIASIRTYTFAGVHASENWTIEINGRVVTVTGSTTGTLTCTAIFNALNAHTDQSNPEVNRFLWTDSGAGMLTATQKDNEAGKEITITIARASGAGTVNGAASHAGTVVTAGDGPNYYSAHNFGGTAPIDSDVIVLANSKEGLLWNLSQSATTPASFIHDMSFTGDFGLRLYNDKKSRQAQGRYLTLGNVGDALHSRLVFGRGPGTGSRFGAYNAGTGRVTVDVFNTGTPYDDEEFALHLLGTHASNILNVGGGSVGVAVQPGEVSTFATVNFVRDETLPQGKLYLGPGCTLANVNNYGGILRTAALFTTGVMTRGGEWTHLEGAIATLSAWWGHVKMYSDGTITTLNVGSNGHFDCSKSGNARSVSVCNAYAGAIINDPNNTINFAGGITCVGCSPSQITLIRKPGTVVSFS